MLATLGNQDIVDDVGISEDKVAEIKRLAIEIFGSSEQFKEKLLAGIYP